MTSQFQRNLFVWLHGSSTPVFMLCGYILSCCMTSSPLPDLDRAGESGYCQIHPVGPSGGSCTRPHAQQLHNLRKKNHIAHVKPLCCPLVPNCSKWSGSTPIFYPDGNWNLEELQKGAIFWIMLIHVWTFMVLISIVAQKWAQMLCFMSELLGTLVLIFLFNFI